MDTTLTLETKKLYKVRTRYDSMLWAESNPSHTYSSRWFTTKVYEPSLNSHKTSIPDLLRSHGVSEFDLNLLSTIRYGAKYFLDKGAIKTFNVDYITSFERVDCFVIDCKGKPWSLTSSL